MLETDLYPPVKRYLEALGYAVKAEITGCDVVAVRGDDLPLIVELKRSLSLQLLCQGVDRQTVTDAVYLAVPLKRGGLSREVLKLCRMLGLGVLSVSAAGSVEVHHDPAAYAPRKNPKRKTLLLKEFTARAGDPNMGGSSRRPLMTAYRQDALLCARFIAATGACKVPLIRNATGVTRAAGILQNNVYGWFQREARGVYGLTAKGTVAVRSV